jgi:glycerol-3-phosphate acyltransferase PlsY
LNEPQCQWLSIIVCVGTGYLSGSLPWGLWLGRLFRRVDVRTLGSGNLGATNVYRTLGPVLGVATLLLDALKGALPVWLLPGTLIGLAFPGNSEWCRVAIGVAAVCGHVWSVFARFRGGKGVATTAGVLLAIAPAAFAVFAAVFVVTVAITRYISLGSVLGAVAFAVTLAARAPAGWKSPTVWLGVLLSLLVVVRHRDNLRRLVRGEERRFSFRGERST